MKLTPNRLLATVFASASIPAALAGPLNPPSGPVTSTMKTLTEVEPRLAINATNTPGDADSMYRISTPGSYYLTGLLLVGPGKMGIEIATDDVTIDLAGYRIGGISGTLSGISLTADHRNITIRNGVLENLQGWGIELDPANVNVRGCLIENIHVQHCVLGGVHVGDGAVLNHVVSTRNSSTGISAAEGCTLTNCAATENSGSGLTTANGCTITGCTATGNTGYGLYGASSTFEFCAAVRNSGGGLEGGSGSVVRGCTAWQNGGIAGIRVAAGSSVEGCTVYQNDRDGIAMYNQCTARNNQCSGNGFVDGGANISVDALRSRLEGNHCTVGNFGIKVTGAENLIRGNSCSGNSTNWSIVAGNFYGAIIDRSGVVPAAVSGNAAPSVLATTDPHANFTY